MGRRLTSLTDGENEIHYAYDASGQRISKTVNGVTTEYYYDDRGALILLSCEDGTGLYFYPEADGSIGSIGINGNRYYYVRNAQNDIIGITDKTGAFVARYTYDEWGNITSITDGNGVDVSANASHIANINPLRYRSYFYDSETGWYWLNTRYYNPEVGRFINADGYVSTGQGILGHNMFAYCNNNPVNYADPSGCIAVSAILLGVALVGCALFLTGCQNQSFTNEEVDEIYDYVYKDKNKYKSTDEAAIALADEVYYNHYDQLIEGEFSSSIWEYKGAYLCGSLDYINEYYSLTEDIRLIDNAASFHTHPIKQSLGFSPQDIQNHKFYLIDQQSDHIEYLLAPDYETNVFKLIRYDRSLPLEKHIPIKTYGE